MANSLMIVIGKLKMNMEISLPNPSGKALWKLKKLIKESSIKNKYKPLKEYYTYARKQISSILLATAFKPQMAISQNSTEELICGNKQNNVKWQYNIKKTKGQRN
jgi:hypothetical protein